MAPTSRKSKLEARRNARKCGKLGRGAAAGHCESVTPEPDSTKDDPTNWTVKEVHQFISSIPGCWYLADEFVAQDIDGRALMLLEEQHLRSGMAMKLGPALKIMARINAMRKKLSRPNASKGTRPRE